MYLTCKNFSLDFFAKDDHSSVPFFFSRGYAFTVRLVLCTALLSLSSQAKIPFFIPFTLQTMAVHFIALLTVPSMAFWSVLTWITLGVSGIPVTSTTVGPSLLVGPTGGYVLGMLISSALMSWLYRHPGEGMQKILGGPSFLRVFFCGMVGSSLTLLWGWSYLGWILSNHHTAFWIGLAPFLIPEFLKVALLSLLTRRSKAFLETP